MGATSGGGGRWTLSAEGSDEVRNDLPQHGPAGSLHQEYDIGKLGERWLPEGPGDPGPQAFPFPYFPPGLSGCSVAREAME